MSAISRYLAPLAPGRGALLWGEHLRLLAAAAAIWGVARKAPVWVVDAANRFDPYRLLLGRLRLVILFDVGFGLAQYITLRTMAE